MIKHNLPRLMDDHGLTPEALAVRMQGQGAAITSTTVRAWMTGHRTPNFPNAQQLARALDCTIDTLLADPENAAV